MRKKLNSILLLDDNLSTNFIHKKFIAEADCAESVVDFQSGIDAIAYLSDKDRLLPELIFIDINMPIMNAWEFLEQYGSLKRADQRSTVIIMLTTSLSPKDEKAKEESGFINDIWIKPLSVETILSIVKKYFPKNVYI